MRLAASVLVLGLLVAPTWADWDPGDGHKMHFPQMPDPNGWDVNMTYQPDVEPFRILADDWMCSETGPVTDIHFWGSWEDDFVGIIEWIDVGIWSDIPDPDPLNPETYSMPGTQLWAHTFHIGEFCIRDWGQGEQGWYDPWLQTWNHPDHTGIVQVNIDIPRDIAFPQEEGTIYWLSLSVRMAGRTGGQFGWKTSQDHWNDDATWGVIEPTGQLVWNELLEPQAPPPCRVPAESLDMAFVITPEPRPLILLAAGVLIFLRRR